MASRKQKLICTFQKQASETWKTLAKAQKIGFHFGEEGLTNLNLLELRWWHSEEVFIRTFAKSEESKIGADWEWWFTDSTEKKFIGFRVQAKVINRKGKAYEQLHYKGGSQTASLIVNALLNDCFTHPDVRTCLQTNPPSLEEIIKILDKNELEACVERMDRVKNRYPYLFAYAVAYKAAYKAADKVAREVAREVADDFADLEKKKVYLPQEPFQNAPLIPIYVLYSSWNKASTTTRPSWKCSKVKRALSIYGCSVVPATVVMAMPTTDLESFLPFMFPWQCLLCDCEGSTGSMSLPERVSHAWRNYSDGMNRMRTETLDVARASFMMLGDKEDRWAEARRWADFIFTDGVPRPGDDQIWQAPEYVKLLLRADPDRQQLQDDPLRVQLERRGLQGVAVFREARRTTAGEKEETQ